MTVSAPVKVKSQYYQLATYNLTICGLFLGVDILAVGLRVWSRRTQKLPLRLDDWLVFPALVLIIGSSIAMIVSIHQHAMGYAIVPPASPSPTDVATAMRPIQETSKAEYAMFLTLVPAITCIKLSFLAFYHRIFCVHKVSRIRYLINGLTAFVLTWGVVFWFAHLFMCGTNFSAFWTSFESLATKCMDTMKMQYAFSITDFVTDVIVLILPIPMLWQLQLQTSRKFAVSLVFLLGSGAVVASAVRLAFVSHVVRKGFSPDEDGDLVITGMMSWLQLEAFLGLLAACLPTIRTLLRGMSPESIINSIRSAFSMHSLHSGHSRLSNDRTGGTDSQRDLTSDGQGINMDERRAEKGAPARDTVSPC